MKHVYIVMVYSDTGTVCSDHNIDKLLIIADSLGYLDMRLKEYYGKATYCVKSIELDDSFDIVLYP